MAQARGRAMRLNLTTLMQFLIGRRVAIEAMAGNRETLLVGVIFCISAALARHYDGKYLLREPWFILAPAGASILTSSILFAAMSVVGSIKARRILPGVVRAYLTFLGLYWMTAPLAWLYGIPYERFLNEVDAAQANVWTLELVSIWRVLLMSRVFSVLVPCSFLSAFSKLGTFALALFYTALIYARMPLVDWMGGVRVPPSVQPVASAYLFVMLFGFFALIAGGLTVLGSLFIAKPEWSLSAFHKVQPGGVGSGVWILALIVILVFSASLPLTQREQRLRYEVERNYKSGNIAEALTTLATHKRTEFPPQWTPPPWPEYEDGARDPKFVQVVEAIQKRRDIPEWITSIYREKAALYLANNRAVPEAVLTNIRSFAGESAPEGAKASSQDQTGKTPLRVEFANPHRSFIVLQTTLGTGECSTNPVLYSPRLDGDVGWVLTTFVGEHDRLCYRISYYTANPGWHEWHEIKRVSSGSDEAYQVRLP